MTGEYQSHSGAVNTSSTPVVQYAYNEMSNGENNSRLTSMTYPSGYTLNYKYNSGLDDSISRLSSISDSGGVLESYKYLGLDTVVERDHPQNNVNQTYIAQPGQPQTGDAGDPYTGLDRFGRVVDQNWVNSTTGVSTDNFQYGYNQDGDVLYKQNLVDAVMSELYQYDSLHQLINFQRGTLNSTDNGIVGTPSASQSWSPDALGNFNSVTTNGTTQTRTANQQNEITSIEGSSAVTYDANGNLTADGSGNTYVYDAWNRLVAVNNGGQTIAAYGYDGLGRRITETHGNTTTDLYYSANWQVLEERVGGVVQARNVWSPVYVDALVLRDQSSQHNGTLDQRLYVQQDADWNVTALVDTTGNVVERYAYTPYGVVTVLNSDFSVRGTSAYDWLYFRQGLRRDSVTGQDDERERIYDPVSMRFLQSDPSGFGGGDVNLYRDEGNEPANGIDPSGLAEPPPNLLGGGFRRTASRDEYAQWVMRNYQTPSQRETMLGLQPMLQLEQLSLVPQEDIELTRAYLRVVKDISPLLRVRYAASLIGLAYADPSLFEGRGSLHDELVRSVAGLPSDVVGLVLFGQGMRPGQTKMTLSRRNGKIRVTVEEIPCPPGKIGLGSLSEMEVAGILQDIEAANKAAGVNSHFFNKHGAQTTLLQQARRAIKGTLPDGSPGNPAAASRFLSHQDQFSALLRAQEACPATGRVAQRQSLL